MSKKKIGFLAGLLAGVTGALLFAPKKGKDFRKDIDKKLEQKKVYDSKVYKFVKGTYDEIKEEGKELAEDAEDLIKKQKEKFLPKRAADKAKDKVKKATKKASSKVKEIKEDLEKEIEGA